MTVARLPPGDWCPLPIQLTDDRSGRRPLDKVESRFAPNCLHHRVRRCQWLRRFAGAKLAARPLVKKQRIEIAVPGSAGPPRSAVLDHF